jgi:hypothetical protein
VPRPQVLSPRRASDPGARHLPRQRQAPDNHATLQAAVDAASAGDTLRVKGTCVGSTTITKDLAITGKPKATLDANHAGRVLTMSGAAVTLTGLTITNGTADWGAGIAILGLRPVSVIDSVISGNTATSYGGGISNDWGGILTLIDSTVSGNTATHGGGISNAMDFGHLYVTGTSSISGSRPAAVAAASGQALTAASPSAIPARSITTPPPGAAAFGATP